MCVRLTIWFECYPTNVVIVPYGYKSHQNKKKTTPPKKKKKKRRENLQGSQERPQEREAPRKGLDARENDQWEWREANLVQQNWGRKEEEEKKKAPCPFNGQFTPQSWFLLMIVASFWEVVGHISQIKCRVLVFITDIPFWELVTEPVFSRNRHLHMLNRWRNF